LYGAQDASGAGASPSLSAATEERTTLLALVRMAAHEGRVLSWSFNVWPVHSREESASLVRTRATTEMPLARELNDATALFVTDLLSCFRRHTTFEAVGPQCEQAVMG
jgi:hypothetical protein